LTRWTKERDVRRITAGLFLWLVACGGTPPTVESVVAAFCARQFRCCLEKDRDFASVEECKVQMSKRFPNGVFPDRAAEYLELARKECSQQDRHGWDRAMLWDALAKPQAEVLKIGYACTRNDQCPTLYDADWRKVGQSMCSCPIQGRENGKCVVQKTCQPPAKHLERCAPFPDRIACDSATFCSIGEGDKSGVCVRRKGAGLACQSARDCLQHEPQDCIQGKCTPIEPTCRL